MVGTVLAALGGAASIASQLQANDINSANAREANALQYKMFQEQLGYNTRERLAVQQYNSPSNQRKLYEQAGINPYLVAGNMNPNSTMQTAPAAPAMHVPKVEPVGFGQAANDIGANYARDLANEQVNLDNQAKRIELQYKTQEKIAQIDNLLADLSSKKEQTRETKARIRNLYLERQMLMDNQEILAAKKPELIQQAKAQTRLSELQADFQDLQNKYQSWFNDFSKGKGKEEINLLLAEIKQAIASAGSYSADTALKIAQEKGVRIDNFQKNKLNWLIRQGQELENKRKRYEMRYPTYIHKLTGLPFIDTESNVVEHSYEQGRKRGYDNGYQQGWINGNRYGK